MMTWKQDFPDMATELASALKNFTLHVIFHQSKLSNKRR